MREPGEAIDIFAPEYEEPTTLIDLPLNIDELVNARIESQKQINQKEKKTDEE